LVAEGNLELYGAMTRYAPRISAAGKRKSER
jgi:hypothetical protein